MQNDVEKLTEALKQRFPTVAPLHHAVWSRVQAAKVIDCVMSLRRDYERFVERRVDRFCAANPDVKTLGDLKRLMNNYGSLRDFIKKELQFDSESRAKTLLGVVEHLIDAVRDHGGTDEEERLRRWAVWARPGDYLAVGVSGFGLAGFQYLRMLFGADTVKPDIHVKRFVSNAINRSVSDLQALYLLERASKLAGVGIREMDVAVWTQGANASKKRVCK